MKKIHIVGLAVFAALAMSAIAASSALAVTSTWLVSGAVSAVQQHVLLTGKLQLEDTKAGPSGEPVRVECEVTEEEALGFVGPGGEDLQEVGAECLNPKFVTALNGPCEAAMAPTVTPDNLPWFTHIELLGGKFYDDLVTEETGAEVGWTVGNCLVLGLAISDLCSLPLGRVRLENKENGTVDAHFEENALDKNQLNANCTRGGAGTGRVIGILTTTALEGLTLAVSEG